jgi:two-component system sensor histidine kinase/response regulator
MSYNEYVGGHPCMFEPHQPLSTLSQAGGDQSQRDLRAQERAEQFRILAEALPNLVWSFDSDGKCMYANRRWTEYTGRTLDELTGHGWVTTLHPDDRDSTMQMWTDSVRGETIFDVEHRIRSSDGEWRWFKTRGTPVKDEGEQTAYWVGTCTDIEDQKRAADMLESRVSERTAELEKLARDLQTARDRAIDASSLKSKFVANISHEIRTPMSGVLGMSELLLTCELNAEAKELADYIYTSAKSLLDVVNDLLDFSKLEAGKVTITRMRFAVPKVVDEVVNTTRKSALQKGLTFDVDMQPDMQDVFGDPIRVRQVLLNLVHNAVKFTSHGGIVVRVREQTRTKNTVIVRFEVTDTGIGINPEQGKHLFNPFEQADGSTTRKYGGTGLGLSISQTLVKLMLGEIGFDSEEDQGSTFWFWIPVESA